MKRYRVAVGYKDNLKPGSLVGAIANEGGLSSSQIGRIEIFEMYSLVDIASDVPEGQILGLKDTWVAGRQIQIRPWDERPGGGGGGGYRKEGGFNKGG
ncbi:DbpA RNA binding domain-containing protein, partial [Arthrospira platensis SPKY1]|nr:DbpA RNA binding domain-containing protein [Arthrospira platensis SPKY1]